MRILYQLQGQAILDVDDISTRRSSTFLNVVALGNVVSQPIPLFPIRIRFPLVTGNLLIHDFVILGFEYKIITNFE